MRVRHFLQFKDFSLDEFEHVFARTRWIKDKFKRYERYWPLEDRTLAMIFEKPSTRTRMSFEAGMHQLGGAAIYLYTRDSQLGRGELVTRSALFTAARSAAGRWPGSAIPTTCATPGCRRRRSSASS